MCSCASSRRPTCLRAWRCVVVLLFSTWGTVTGRGQAEALPISLPEELLPELNAVLHHAMAVAPDIQLANLDLARAEANYLVARAALLPTVAARSHYSISTQRREGDTASESDDQGFFYDIGVTQPLYHWGARKAERDIGELSRLIEQKRVGEARSRLASVLRNQYLGLIIRNLGLAAARRAHELTARGLAAAEERFRAGTLSEAEIVTTRLAAEETALDLRRAEHDVETHVRMFAQLAGDPTFTAERIADEIPSPLFAPELLEARFEALSSEMIRDLPAAEILELQQQQNEKRYAIERVRLRPKVSLQANHGLVNLTTATTATIDQTAVVTTTAAVAVNWTIFDGFAARGAQRAALAAKRRGEREFESFLERTFNDLRRMQREIRMSAQALSLAERRARLTEDALERARADFEAGRIAESTLDAHVSQSQQSALNVAKARGDLLARWIEYVTVSGLDPWRSTGASAAEEAGGN